MNKSRISNEGQRGHLIVLSGPSGAGKGTILAELMSRRNADLSVSCTTRAPRDGEIDGTSYYFISPEEFEQRVEAGDFLEYAEVFGNRYGTPRREVEEKLKQGRDVVLEIDVQGAKQIKKSFPDARLIFVEPPSMEVLKERLKGRGTETDEQVATRFSKAQEEMKHASEYDFRIVNDEVEKAVRSIEDYLTGVTAVS